LSTKATWPRLAAAAFTVAGVRLPLAHDHDAASRMLRAPVADARSQLSKLIDQAASTHERFEIGGFSASA
jgi:hypothetical protein